ncbi:MAG: hypothetical protein AAFQ79_13100 [Pseudomonadota bacterium]
MLHSITILERDPVIAQDIGETLAELFPGVTVSLFSTLRDLCDALIMRAEDAGLAVLHGTSDELRDPELARLTALKRIRVVAIQSPTPEAATEGWIFLPPPFTTPDLKAALRRALDL